MKYYVNSGDVQFIIDAADEDIAVKKFIDNCDAEDLGRIICVNQQGFNCHHSGDVYYDSLTALA